MFRLIASGAQQGLRPSLILKVKPPTTTTTTSTTSKFTSTTQHFPFENNNLLGYQVRNNSFTKAMSCSEAKNIPPRNRCLPTKATQIQH